MKRAEEGLPCAGRASEFTGYAVTEATAAECAGCPAEVFAACRRYGATSASTAGIYGGAVVRRGEKSLRSLANSGIPG
jgi:hypothetical protein